jgi:hypothetical protein
LHAPQDVAHARQQFPGIHGLGEIVVRAHFEPHDTIDLVGAAPQDDEGHIACGTQASTQPHAVLLAEMHVEHDQIDARALERALHAAATAGRGDAVAVSFQVTRKHGASLAVLIDYEYVFMCSHRTFACYCHERD